MMISNETQFSYNARNLLIPYICNYKNLSVRDMITNVSSETLQKSSINNNIQQKCFEQQVKSTKILTTKNSNSYHQVVEPIDSVINCVNDSNTHYDKYIKPIFCGYYNTMSVDLSKTYISGHTSVASLSKLNGNNMPPMTCCKHESWESFCNFSGYDYQDCLGTKSDMDKDPKLSQLSKILSEINTKNGNYLKQCRKYQNSKISQVESIDKKQNSPKKTGTLLNKCKVQNVEKYCSNETGLKSQKKNCGSSVTFQDSVRKITSKKITLPLPEHINNTKLTKNVEKNKFQYIDALVSDKQVESFTSNKQNCTWNDDKNSQHFINKNINLFNIDEDFKIVRDTLQEAREFSSHLMEILERYEKANREFESISEKLKLCYEKKMCTKNSEAPIIMNKGDGQNESLNEVECTIDKYLDQNGSLQKESDLNEDQSCSFKGRVLTKVNYLKDGNNASNKIGIKLEPSNIISNKDSNARVNKPINKEYIETCNKFYKDECNFKDSSQNALLNQTMEIEKNTKLIQKNSIANCNDILSKRNIISNKISFINMDTQKFQSTINMPTEISDINLSLTIAEEKKSYSLPIKIKHTEDFKNYNKRCNIPQIMKKNCVRFSSTDDIIASPVTIDDVDVIEHNNKPELPINVLVIENSEINGDPLLNKNICLHYNGWQNNGSCNTSLLDDKFHMTVNSISMQTSTSFEINYELNNSHHENSTLDQVSELLRNMPVEQTRDSITTEEIALNYNSPLQDDLYLQNMRNFCHNGSLSMSPRCSNDLFKVCFRNLRRVSDHTVLVKWKLPQAIDDVEGYELLVDGLPVEKFSPNRRMAVVTCLPRSDKVLITMRTLTTKPCEEGYYPSANIIYRPRIT